MSTHTTLLNGIKLPLHLHPVPCLMLEQRQQHAMVLKTEHQCCSLPWCGFVVLDGGKHVESTMVGPSSLIWSPGRAEEERAGRRSPVHAPRPEGRKRSSVVDPIDAIWWRRISLPPAQPPSDAAPPVASRAAPSVVASPTAGRGDRTLRPPRTTPPGIRPWANLQGKGGGRAGPATTPPPEGERGGEGSGRG